MGLILLLIRRDVALAWGQPGGGAIGLLFYLAVVTCFPFAIGPDPVTLARVAVGVLWVGVLLAALIGLERMFQPDAEDGTLDQLVSHGVRLETIVVARMVAHWIAGIAPVLLATPVAALMLNMPPERLPALLLSLLIGTPALTAIGAVAAALAVGVRRGALLICLIVLPLMTPVVIFGVASLDTPGGAAALKLLAAVTLASLAVGPFAAAAGLRLSQE